MPRMMLFLESYSDVLTDENEIYEQYLSGDIPDDENKYYYFIKHLNKFVTPFSKTNDVQNLLIERTMSMIILMLL